MTLAWSIVAQAGFWGWLATTTGFILTVFPGRGLFRGRKALLWGVPMLCCYLVWVAGMLQV